MTSNDMNQIRELLIGEFSQEVKSQLKLLDKRLTQLHEDNKRDIDTIEKTLESKINKVHKVSNERYESIKLLLEQRINEQNSIMQNEVVAIENILATQHESTKKSLNLLKTRMQSKLNDLEETNSRKNVSKESLASMFLEYSLKLKDTTLADKIKEKIEVDAS
ncbi:MAG: hypothetical protein U9R27_01100 [Campylobacterota bacterium]|nr:hypothetical protein [Campylobacterota bacterium]